MTTIVTFLGDRGLRETKYKFGDRDKSYTGGVFAEVLVQFCEFDRMIVCVTAQAKLSTWGSCSKRTRNNPKPEISTQYTL
jgi:hypothetical protein